MKVDRNRGSGVRTQRLSLWLAASVVVLCGVSLLFPKFGGKELALLLPSGKQTSTLSCAQVRQIGKWAGERYGGNQHVDLKARAFSNHVVEGFLEKLDPYKLLFTESEADKFRKNGVKAWESVIGQQQCDYFTRWVSNDYENAKARFKKRLTSSAFPTPMPQKKKVSANSDKEQQLKVPKLKAFAKNEAELLARLNDLLKVIAQSTDPRVLQSFHNDRQKFFTDSIDQILFQEGVQSMDVLAKAMLGSFDPYSTYFSSNEFEEFYYDLSGGTAGVGVRVRTVPEGLFIEKIIKGSAAEQSRKIQVGDIIMNVDNVALPSLPVSAAKRLLRGQAHTHIKMVLKRGVQGKPFTVELERKHFTFEDTKITHRWLTPRSKAGADVAVVEVPSFYGRGGLSTQEENSSAEDLKKVLSELMSAKKKPSALVLDLRGNPGGFLEEAVSMAGLFLGDKPVVGLVENNSRRVLHDHHKTPVYQGPLVLLLDEGAASASEVLAGAMKDYRRALLVGSPHTYGKGSVQRLFHLDEELPKVGTSGERAGVVKLTTSIFYSPMGHSPSNGGVSTDVPLSLISDQNEYHAPKSGSVSVPEVHPFLDDKQLSEVKAGETVMKDLVAQLGEASKARTQKFLKGESADEEDLMQEVMNLASDYVALEKKMASSPKISLSDKPASPIRNLRRHVVGY